MQTWLINTLLSTRARMRRAGSDVPGDVAGVLDVPPLRVSGVAHADWLASGGDHGAVIPLLRKEIPLALERNHFLQVGHASLLLAESLLATGDAHGAADAARAGLVHAQSLGQRSRTWQLRAVLADAIRASDPDGAAAEERLSADEHRALAASITDPTLRREFEERWEERR